MCSQHGLSWVLLFSPLRRPICSLVAWLFPTSWPIKLMFLIYKLDCYFYCLCCYCSHQESPSVTSWLVKYGFISLSVCLFCTKHQYYVVWRFRCIFPQMSVAVIVLADKKVNKWNCSMPESMVLLLATPVKICNPGFLTMVSNYELYANLDTLPSKKEWGKYSQMYSMKDKLHIW